MSNMYAMRRANGDWFAFEDGGLLRMPVFRSRRDALLARSSNGGMSLFKPEALDERAVEGVGPEDDGVGSYFWLVDSPSADGNRGRRIERAQLALLVRDAGAQDPAESAA